MRVVDLNILLYAVNRDTPLHEAARRWLEEALSGEAPVALPWVVVLGFLRLSTSHRVFPQPLAPDQAIEVVDGWLHRPVVRLLDPGPEHWPTLRRLLGEAGTAGNLTTDAHLAALAVAHGAELVSADTDFARFRDLRWTNPLGDGTPAD